MFVLLSRFQQPFEAIQRLLVEHSAWVQSHYDSGRFLVSGRQEPPVGGVIVARAESEQELREILALDPLQQMGLAAYDIIAFEAADFPKRSQAFALFASKPLQKPPATKNPQTRG